MSDLARLVAKLRKQAAFIPSGPTIALSPPPKRDCLCADCLRARDQSIHRDRASYRVFVPKGGDRLNHPPLPTPKLGGVFGAAKVPWGRASNDVDPQVYLRGSHGRVRDHGLFARMELARANGWNGVSRASPTVQAALVNEAAEKVGLGGACARGAGTPPTEAVLARAAHGNWLHCRADLHDAGGVL